MPKPKLRIIEMPRDVKDPSALHIKNPNTFKREFKKLTRAGKVVALRKPDAEAAEDGGVVVVEDGLPESLSRIEKADQHHVGLAKRFANQHRGKVCYAKGLGWLYFDGRRWERLGHREITPVMTLAMETARSLMTEVERETDGERKETLFKFYMASNRAPALDAMVKLAKSFLLVDQTAFDADSFLLTCLNGTVDLRTGKLRGHDSADFITRLVPINYDPEAKAPRFQKFLKEIYNGNRDLIGYTQRAAGYSLTADTREQCLFICYGDAGSNGKTILLRLLQNSSGEYSHAARPELLIQSRFVDSRADIAALKGIRLVVTSETEEGARLNESQVKQLTGEDSLNGRFLYGEQFRFKPTHKIWLITNAKPVITGTNHAIWRRLKLLPFEVIFKKRGEKIEVQAGQKVLAADTNLYGKLSKEQAGILAWQVRGAVAWWNQGKPDLREPDNVRTKVAEYRADQDVVGEFVSEECVKSKEDSIPSAELAQRFNLWLEAHGKKKWSTTLISKRFGHAPFHHGTRDNQRSIIGLRFKDNVLAAAEEATTKRLRALPRDDSPPDFKQADLKSGKQGSKAIRHGKPKNTKRKTRTK